MGPGRQAASSACPAGPCCHGTLSLLGATDNRGAGTVPVQKESQRRSEGNILQGPVTVFDRGHLARWRGPSLGECDWEAGDPSSQVLPHAHLSARSAFPGPFCDFSVLVPKNLR